MAVSTPRTRPSLTAVPVTLARSTTSTPRRWAPRARAWVRSEGFALPSPGSHTPPTRSSVRMTGHSSPASLAVTTSAAMP